LAVLVAETFMEFRNVLLMGWLLVVRIDTLEGSVEIHLLWLRVRGSNLLFRIILLLAMNLRWHM
jgi:hypothetical protein